jgi:hypothetical protein
MVEEIIACADNDKSSAKTGLVESHQENAKHLQILYL